MPPRKSNASIASNGPEDGAESTPAKVVKDGLSVEDLSLPKSMIARLAKGVLPANTQIHKDALLALHKSATVFVSYIASNSNELAQAGGKKTIAPHDVMAALKDCELEDFIPRLEAELKKYNEVQCDKRNTYRRKVKEEKAAAAVPDGGDGGDGEVGEVGETSAITEPGNDTSLITNGHDGGEDQDRPTKKFKAADGTPAAPDTSGLDDDDMDVDQDGEEEVDDQHEDDDVEDEEDEEDEPDEDPGAQLVDDPDPDEDGPSLSGVRDEALDDGGSESD